MDNELTVEQRLAIRKEAALQIDPQTAEVHWGWRNVCDPYGLGLDLTEEEQCVGRVYFARAPESDVWVEFGDLPDAIRDALWEKIEREAAAERGVYLADPEEKDIKKDEKAIEQWLAIRKEAGSHIDPETAEITWRYAPSADPYCINPDLPEELQQIGREYFARSPGSDVWVSFDDIPDAIRNALWERHTYFRPWDLFDPGERS